MPDEDDKQKADEETLPDTSLHAYAHGDEEAVEGDVDKMTSGDPEQLQREEIEDEEDSDSDKIEPPPKE